MVAVSSRMLPLPCGQMMSDRGTDDGRSKGQEEPRTRSLYLGALGHFDPRFCCYCSLRPSLFDVCPLSIPLAHWPSAKPVSLSSLAPGSRIVLCYSSVTPTILSLFPSTHAQSRPAKDLKIRSQAACVPSALQSRLDPYPMASVCARPKSAPFFTVVSTYFHLFAYTIRFLLHCFCSRRPSCCCCCHSSS